MKVAGTALKATLDFAQEKFGEAGVEKILEQVKRKGLNFSQPVLISEWYPFEVHAVLSESLDQIFGKGDGKLLWTVGVASADNAFKLFGAAFPKTPDRLLAQLKGVFWPAFYDFGKVEVIQEGERAIRLRMFEVPATRTLCQRAFGFTHRGLELTGAKNLKMEETACMARGQERCEVSASWDA